MVATNSFGQFSLLKIEFPIVPKSSKLEESHLWSGHLFLEGLFWGETKTSFFSLLETRGDKYTI